MSFETTLLREVMNPVPCTIAPHASLAEAAARMLDEDRTCLIVDLGDPTRGWGILTQKDVLAVMAEMDVELESLRVEDVMTHPSMTLPPTYDVATCVQSMRMLGVRRAAVVEGTELVGFVSFTDVFRWALRGKKALRRAG